MGIYSMNFRTCWGSRENKTSWLEKETLARWAKCDSFSIVMLKFPLQHCYKKLLQPTDFGAAKKFTFVWSFLQNCFSLVTSWHRSEIDCFNSAIASRDMQKASKGLLSFDVDLLQFHIENVSMIYIQDAWMSKEQWLKDSLKGVTLQLAVFVFNIWVWEISFTFNQTLLLSAF